MYLVNTLSLIRKVAGIPNIIGYMGIIAAESLSVWGSFYKADAELFQFNRSSGANTGGRIGFSANLSSNIYGSSSTVTPLSLSCKYLISY